MARSTATQPIDREIISRIYGKGRGYAFTTADFYDLGNPKAVDKAVENLCNRGSIRRLDRGLYDYPVRHPELGDLYPSPETVARALAGRDNLRIQPSGAHAANQLGLSLQVPAQIVFLTDGSGRNRTVQIGNQQIILKRTTPRNMGAAGRISGLVIQALRHLGQPHVDDTVIRRLDSRLTAADRKTLMRDIRFAPAWIAKIIHQLCRRED